MNLLSERNIARALVAAVILSIFVAALTFTGVIGGRSRTKIEAAYSPDGASLLLASFRDIDGWRSDAIGDAIEPFLRSCARLEKLPDDAPMNASEYLGPGVPDGATLAGRVGDWRRVCAEAAVIAARPYADDSARASGARSFFEYYFRPVKLHQRLAPEWGGSDAILDPKGRFTGYFEPFYEASAFRTAEFSAPVYARPADLVMIDLGRFRPELSGTRIAGRIVDGALDPYPDHAAINGGALAGRARVLAYMRPSDLLFLQIQGSGRLRLAEGELRLGYDGANGRVYTAIGRTLIEMGALTKENVSMQTIRAWLDKAPDDAARKVRESNESFVFFRVLDTLPDGKLGPPGAEGVQLTPGRSLAVDPRYVAYGAPVFISIPGDEARRRLPVRRLMIAQDTGGAIKGPVRGDIFVGSGPLAGRVAGAFNEMGEMYALVPQPLADRLAAESKSR